MNKINFELYNTSDIFLKYKMHLELLMAIYGDNVRISDIIKEK